MEMLAIHHLIYSRVEPEYSLKGFSGFQTVYCSPAIQRDAAEIEARLQCYVPDTTPAGLGAAEHQYFWTVTGNAVVVRISPITPDPKVIDAARWRAGHFVAHALIVERATFAAVGNDPFAIIEAAEQSDVFVTGVERLVQYLRRAPPDRLQATRRTRLHESLAGWRAEAVRTLVHTAQSAADLRDRNRALLLLSRDSDRIYTWLSAALFLSDSDHRAACTFHTAVDGCPPYPGAYWVLGAREQVDDAPAFLVLDLDTYAWENALRQIGTKTSPYLRWLQQELSHSLEAQDGMYDVYTAQITAECLAAKRPLPSERLAERALVTFREANLNRYMTGQTKALVAALGRPAGAQLSQSWLTLVGVRNAIDSGAMEWIDQASYAHAIYGWIVMQHKAITTWGGILRYAQTVRFAPLIAIAGAKARPGILRSAKNARASAAAIDQLAMTGELARWLPDFAKVLAARDYVTAVSAPVVAAETVPEALTDAGFFEVAAALIRHDARLLDKRYASRARRLKGKNQAKELLELLSTSGRANRSFAAALRSVP
jgi:hypothetical protein